MTRQTAGGTIAELLIETGRYLNVFETGNFQNGVEDRNLHSRIATEAKLFGARRRNIELLTTLHAAERPVYGLLNYLGRRCRAASFFGESTFVLRPYWRERAIYTPMDTFLVESEEVYAWQDIAGVLASTRPGQPWFRHVLDGTEPPPATHGAYIDTQIFGPIQLGRDVEHLYVPTGYRGSHLRHRIEELRNAFGFEISYV